MTHSLVVHVSWFEAAVLRGMPALGTPETLPWSDIASIIADNRRIGTKDGPGFVPARFVLEQDGRHVRRLGRNVVARTMLVLDCEGNKQTGELPPPPAEVVARLLHLGVAGVCYSSHSHTPDSNPRYRVVVPLSEEIAPDLPAVEILAGELNLAGVLDRSKITAASLFYLPSASCFDDLDHHEAHVVTGRPIDAAMMRERASALLGERQAEQDRIAAEAHAEAQRRLQKRIAAGFDPDDSLIEKLRSRLDLDSILRSHGYDTSGRDSSTKYRHPASQSGQYGADIKVFGGIPRVFSHNGGDPLHASNLPDSCTVTAIDAFDVTVILDFGGDRNRALRELAQRFGLVKATERKQIARMIHKAVERGDTDNEIMDAAFAEGLEIGLSRDDVRQVARYVATKAAA